MLKYIYRALKHAIMIGDECQNWCCRTCRAISRPFRRQRGRTAEAEGNTSPPALEPCVECAALRAELRQQGDRITKLENQQELVLAANAGTSAGATSRQDVAFIRALALKQLSSSSDGSDGDDSHGHSAQTQTTATEDITQKDPLQPSSI